MRTALGLALCCVLITCQSARPTRSQLLETAESALCQGDSGAVVELLRRQTWAWQGAPRDDQATQLALYQIEALLNLKEDRRADQLIQQLVIPAQASPALHAHQAMLQGLIAQRAQQSELAWTRLLEAREIAQSSGRDRILARVLNMMAYLRYMHGDLDGAMGFDKQAVAAAQRAGEVPTRLKALNNLGVHLMTQHNYEEAVFHLEQAQALLQQEDPNYGDLLINLGAAYSITGNFDRAESLFAEYEALPAKLQANRQKYLGELGSHYVHTGRYDEAFTALHAAFEQARGDQQWAYAGLWAGNLARLMAIRDRWEEGDQWFNEAKSFMAKAGSTGSWTKLFEVNLDINRCRFDHAEALALELMTQASLSDDPDLGWKAKFTFGALLDAMGAEELAMTYLQSSIDELEESPGMIDPEDQIFYFSSLVRFHKGYVDHLMRRNLSDQALLVAESSRARLLRFRRMVAAPEADLAKLAVPKDTAMLAYWLSEQESYLWVLTGDTRRVFRLPSQQAITDLVAQHTLAVQNLTDPIRMKSADSVELGRILLGQAKDAIRGKRRVVIVADGGLHRLAFETLASPDRPGHYWAEDQELCLTPSLSLYLSHPQTAVPIDRLLLVGHPDFQTKSLPPLPGAIAELATIQSHFLGHRHKLLTGQQATRKHFFRELIQQYDVIHFATHAVVNDYAPLSSAVMLSPEQDGLPPSRISAQDFMVEDLSQVHLVTLSACSSAGVQTYSGEGLTGLAWAFLWSGAHHVVASHWNVDDKATSQLMDVFYAHLSLGENPVEALRQAKLKLIRSEGRYRKPYYWGAFQIFMR